MSPKILTDSLIRVKMQDINSPHWFTVCIRTYPGDDSCSKPSSRRRNTPPELLEKALQVTKSSRQRGQGRSAPSTRSEDNSDPQGRRWIEIRIKDERWSANQQLPILIVFSTHCACTTAFCYCTSWDLDVWATKPPPWKWISSQGERGCFCTQGRWDAVTGGGSILEKACSSSLSCEG